MDKIIFSRGNYKTLLTYKKADVIFQMTSFFCRRFLNRNDRTVDQMVQAARSGKQNILEGRLSPFPSAMSSWEGLPWTRRFQGEDVCPAEKTARVLNLLYVSISFARNMFLRFPGILIPPRFSNLLKYFLNLIQWPLAKYICSHNFIKVMAAYILWW